MTLNFRQQTITYCSVYIYFVHFFVVISTMDRVHLSICCIIDIRCIRTPLIHTHSLSLSFSDQLDVNNAVYCKMD